MQTASARIADEEQGPLSAFFAETEEAARETDGFFQRIDDYHTITHIKGNNTLFVSFERADEAATDGRLFAAKMHEVMGWSTLTLIATADTWGRAKPVYRLFDDLIDDEWFEDFHRVFFFGAGLQAYAACAYSVAAPGATVIAFSPQATLDPGYAGWDTRFAGARRIDFSSRFGYAPLMCEAAKSVHVFYDPTITEDACHAAQFNQSHMHLHRLRHYGPNPARFMQATGELEALLRAFDAGTPSRADLARIFRARRDNAAYLRRLLGAAGARQRLGLEAMICRNVLDRLGHAPRFKKRLSQIDAAATP